MIDPATDPIHARLVAAVEKPERAQLWSPADAITFTPRVLPKVYGDGRALFALSTIHQRPAYWVIRCCSTWGSDLDLHETTRPNFREMTDEILSDLEEAFGNGLCGYSGNSLFQPRRYRMRICQCEDCSDRFVAKWPMVRGDDGCSWGRMAWPEGFATEDAHRHLLTAAQSDPRREGCPG
ncbi:hypothetical protein [Luteimonas saliphila]|uniref:hypothetical protein n=1 Tax=Luteimonas saliphila TaxID=2804919 RepID=UPI00192E0C08|nr:hypothetical protein [Luteimonas saliphila]